MSRSGFYRFFREHLEGRNAPFESTTPFACTLSISVRRQKLGVPEAQFARNYGTGITQIPGKNYGAQNNSKTFSVMQYLCYDAQIDCLEIRRCNVIVLAQMEAHHALLRDIQ